MNDLIYLKPLKYFALKAMNHHACSLPSLMFEGQLLNNLMLFGTNYVLPNFVQTFGGRRAKFDIKKNLDGFSFFAQLPLGHKSWA